MSGCVVKKCTCKASDSACADYQDKKYGNQMRVMNLDQKKSDATCTVCGKSVKL